MDSVENLRENINLLKMANFEDFKPIFCFTAQFAKGGGPHSCKIFTGASISGGRVLVAVSDK